MVNSLGRVLEPENLGAWKRIQEQQPGTVEILHQMEQYATVLAHNMLQLFTQPFDAVNENIGESCRFEDRCARECFPLR